MVPSKAGPLSLVSVGLALVLLSFGRALAEEIRFDAQALRSRAVLNGLQVTADGAAVVLHQGRLFEDDGPAAGYSYRPNEETLSADTRIKKELLIPNPRAREATLLFAPGGSLRATINGRNVDLQAAGKAGNYWQTFRFPPDVLWAGKNEFVLSGNGKLWIARDDEFAAGSTDRTRHPNRSAKSSDGGKTWDYDRLGDGNDVDGEYYVRVFLVQYQPRGSLVLDVLDVGNLSNRPLAAPLATIGPVRIDAQAEPGATGRVMVRARTGTRAIADTENWSPWQDLGLSGELERPAGRYLQIMVELATDDPLRSPRLKALSVRAAPTTVKDWTERVTVVECHNEEIIRTAIPFQYEPFDHPRLRLLRETHKLDDVVRGARGDLDLATRLAAWSARQFERGHLHESYPPWDALEILKTHADGTAVGGFCQQRNLVLLQACESFGLPGRAVSIGPGGPVAKIRGGHEAIEIWCNEPCKWVYVDGDAGWHFRDEKTKTPLSLWELRQRQLAAFREQDAEPVELMPCAEMRYAWKGLQGWPPVAELRLIPRSNFLAQRSPLPLNQGMRGWFWTGHYVWSDDQVRAALLYGNRVIEARNFNWTLNQAHYRLEATDRPGVIRVYLDTETPGFDTFLAEWDGCGRHPVPACFEWKLHPGRNRLETRPRNIGGREGIASWIAVDYREGPTPEK